MALFICFIYLFIFKYVGSRHWPAGTESNQFIDDLLKLKKKLKSTGEKDICIPIFRPITSVFPFVFL